MISGECVPGRETSSRAKQFVRCVRCVRSGEGGKLYGRIIRVGREK